MKVTDIRPNPKNPRHIDDEALDRLKNSIRRDPQFMELRPIVVDVDGMILGGNMRYRAIQGLGMTEIPDGWVVRADSLTPEQQRRFILVDNAPDGMSGSWDDDMLKDGWSEDELKDLGFDFDSGIDDTYTKKIKAPVYEPKGECPDVETLYDHEKTDRLVADIMDVDLPADVAKFLCLAAERHTAFNFRRIAEYYCHADECVQVLMERSGLVIIDFQSAIENGFVHMTKQLSALADIEDVEDDDDGESDA